MKANASLWIPALSPEATESEKEQAVRSVRATLLPFAEAPYRDFQASLLPTLPRQAILGVRTPTLRRLAKSLQGTRTAAVFLSCLPHDFFEENQLHAFLLDHVKDGKAVLGALETFLPYVNNWATCDQMNPPALSQDLPDLYAHCLRWLHSDAVYTVRYGVVTLMRYFLACATPDEDAHGEDLASKVLAPAAYAVCQGPQKQAYYVQMAVAWLFATALSVRWEDTLPFLVSYPLPPAVLKATRRKAQDSYRIPPERKAQLRSLPGLF
jgi:hypothetical protein